MSYTYCDLIYYILILTSSPCSTLIALAGIAFVSLLIFIVLVFSNFVGVTDLGLCFGEWSDFSFAVPKFTGSDIRRSGILHPLICIEPMSCAVDERSPIVDIEGTDKRFSADPSIRFAKCDCNRCKCADIKCEDGGGGKLCPPFVIVDISLDLLELPGEIGS